MSTISVPSINFPAHEIFGLIIAIIIGTHIIWTCVTLLFVHVSSPCHNVYRYVTCTYLWRIPLRNIIYTSTVIMLSLMPTTINVQGLDDLNQRCKWLSMVGLILCICMGSNPYFLRIFSTPTISKIHVLCAIFSLFNGIIHSSLVWIQQGKPGSVHGVVAVSLMGLVVLSGFFRSFHAFKIIHRILVMGLVIVLYCHLITAPRKHIYGAVMLSCLIAPMLIRSTVKLYYWMWLSPTCKILTGHPYANQEIGRLHDVVYLAIEVRRKHFTQPGQYYNVSFATIATLQSDSFFVVWQTDRTMYFLVDVQNRNLNRFMGLVNSPNSPGPRPLLEGPYGPLLDLHTYGNVLFVATGLGITSVMSHIQGIRNKHHLHDSTTQSITLIWYPEFPQHINWIREWLNSLLEKDNKNVSCSHGLYETCDLTNG